MISNTLTTLLLIGLAAYFFMVLMFLKNKTLALKYTLLWLLAGVVLLFFVLCPRALHRLTDFVGMSLPVNLLFTCSIGCILMILMAITAIVSAQKSQIKRLSQEIACLEKRIRDMEQK